jgi:SAM-dependent methyltransferase
MNKPIVTEEKVKRANRLFYDIAGSGYEVIDGRRSVKGLKEYLAGMLRDITSRSNRESILDLGCGAGFLSGVARGIYTERYALDISHGILRIIHDTNLRRIVADSDLLPLHDSTIDCVAAFAVLHHCYAFERMFTEAFRVLRQGGIFYSDHDMDRSFFRRFKPLLSIYRMFNNARRNYRKQFSQISDEIYDHSEFHQHGIPSNNIRTLLERAGFKEYHWYGLSSLIDWLFGHRTFSQGYAPLARITARKCENT